MYLETYLNFKDQRKGFRHSFFSENRWAKCTLSDSNPNQYNVFPWKSTFISLHCFLLQSLLRSVWSWWYKWKIIPRTLQEFDCNIKYSCLLFQNQCCFQHCSPLAYSQNSNSRYQQHPEMPIIVYVYNYFQFVHAGVSHNTQDSSGLFHHGIGIHGNFSQEFRNRCQGNLKYISIYILNSRNQNKSLEFLVLSAIHFWSIMDPFYIF